jgi:heme/copper-type cytochrome/quinol oxidase subunit 1
MGAMAAVYYWLPKWTGHMLNERMGRLHFWVVMIGFNLTFIPQFMVGLAGMPRRIPDYPLMFTEWNMLSTVGAFILGASHLIFIYNVIQCIRGGQKAEAKAWEGAKGWSGQCHRPRLTIPLKRSAHHQVKSTAQPKSDAAAQQPVPTPSNHSLEWVEARRKNNLKLGLALGGFVLAIFFLALWKYRPI